jgi:hypothetical protein
MRKAKINIKQNRRQLTVRKRGREKERVRKIKR